MDGKVVAVAAGTAIHDELMIDIKTAENMTAADVIAAQRTVESQMQTYARMIGKSKVHAYAYGSGPQQMLRGNRPDMMFFDEASRFVHTLPFPERCWSRAFRQVLGVGERFYDEAPPVRKRWLENHYTVLAANDTQKGRKAAKIVAVRVTLAIAGEPVKAWDTGVSTGRMMMGGPALQNIARVQYPGGSTTMDEKAAKKFEALMKQHLGLP